MNHPVRWVLWAVTLLAATSALRAQNSECQSVRFSDDVLARYPRAADACLDVITREGQQYAVFKAQLDEVRGNTLRLRFKHPDGSRGAPINVQTKSDLKLLINGEPATVADLAPNQELTAYVRVDRPMLALAPPTDTDPLYAVPFPAPEAAAMPHTAGSLGIIALLGQLCFAAAFALTAVRKRRK